MGKRYLSEREFQKQLYRLKRENVQKERWLQLEKERRKFDKAHIETSKLIAIYLFILLNAIVVYSMVAMWVFADLSYLGVLVSDIAAQVLIYAIYCMKAYHGKKQSEQVKLDREKLNGSLGDVLSAGSESADSVPLTKGSIDVPVSVETDGYMEE